LRFTGKYSREKAPDFDYDDYDHRIIEKENAEKKMNKKEQMKDIDDYDHRSRLSHLIEKKEGEYRHLDVPNDPIQYAAEGIAGCESAPELDSDTRKEIQRNIEQKKGEQHHVHDEKLGIPRKGLPVDPIQYAAEGSVTVDDDDSNEMQKKLKKLRKAVKEKEDFVRHHAWE